MRIALFSTSWLDFYVVELVKALAPRHEIMVVVDQHDTLHSSLGLESLEVVRIPWLPSRRHPFRNLNAIRHIAARLSAFRPDVVHFQEHDPRIPLLMPLMTGIPIVLDLHNVDPLPGMEAPVRDRFRDYTRNRIDSFVVHGSAMKAAIGARYHSSAANVFVIPFGKFSAFGDGATHRSEARATVALFFGRIEPYKGLGTLCAAVPRVAELYPGPFCVRIAGEGDLAPYLPADRSHLDIVNERVRDPSPFFRDADLVVLPYTRASTSGVTPVAYAHEKPVIVTSVGSLAETVRDGVTGLVVPPEDPVALAAAIARLFNDAALRRRMGSAGRELLETELGWERNIGAVEDAYHHAAAHRNGKRVSA